MSFLFSHAILTFVVLAILLIVMIPSDKIISSTKRYALLGAFFIVALGTSVSFDNGKALYLTELPDEFVFIHGTVVESTPFAPGGIWLTIRTKDSPEPLNVKVPFDAELANAVLMLNFASGQTGKEFFVQKRDKKTGPTQQKQPQPEEQAPVDPKSKVAQL